MAFQSTHPRGVRPFGQVRVVDVDGVSIHAPAWGATSPWNTSPDAMWMFQSTHPRGVRPSRELKKPEMMLFQSTHPRGVRPYPILLILV